MNWPAVAWVLTAIIVNGVSLKLAPNAYREAVDLTAVAEGDRAGIRQALDTLHLTTAHLAWFQIFTEILSSFINLGIGWLLIRRPPRTGFSCYLAFVLLALSSPGYPPSIDDLLPGQPISQFVLRVTTLVAIGGFFTLPFVFPDGRFVPRWTVLVSAYAYLSVFLFIFVPSLSPEGGAWVVGEIITTIGLVGSLVYAAIHRYRTTTSLDQRLQLRWVMLGMVLGIPLFFIADAMMRNIGSSTFGIICLFGFLVLIQVAFTIPIAAIGIAILHHRLFDIDVILSRTLVWLTLSAGVILAYIGVVVGLGNLLGTERNLLLSVLATGLVAVAFQPLRDRVQRTVNRVLFGERDDPYAVLSRLGHRIEDAVGAGELLPQIVHTTVEALRLPYAALFLDRVSGLELVASAGNFTASTLRLPLTYQGQPVGALDVAERSPGEAFNPSDRRLLEDLARQIGIAAHTVNLAGALQQSRQAIVTSREEERRRLRRDLHDGLGAQLAALIMQTGTIRSQLRSDPDAADRELQELRDELKTAVSDVRRLVHGLRPPALDELGLAGALRARLERMNQAPLDDVPGLQVQFTAREPLPSLPAAVEVATMHIVDEAVTNVVHHANARHLAVTIDHEDDTLVVTIADDGTGFAISQITPGIGLQSMRERARELGGTWTMSAGESGTGCTVTVRLPARLEGT